MKFHLKKGCTVTLKLGVPCNFFKVNRKGTGLYFFRHTKGMETIKVNFPHGGHYATNVPAKVIAIEPLTPCFIDAQLPEKERNREKPYHIVHDQKGASPAAINTMTGKIRIGEKFKKYPFPVRLFILLHEYGHFFYKTEWKCDLFAAIMFLQLGYNPSTAFYSLSKVLRRNNKAPLSPITQTDDRILRLFNSITQ